MMILADLCLVEHETFRLLCDTRSKQKAPSLSLPLSCVGSAYCLSLVAVESESGEQTAASNVPLGIQLVSGCAIPSLFSWCTNLSMRLELKLVAVLFGIALVIAVVDSKHCLSLNFKLKCPISNWKPQKIDKKKEKLIASQVNVGSR